MTKRSEFTRRTALIAGAVGVTGAGLGALGNADDTPEVDPEQNGPAKVRPRMPVVFLPHGGGPWPFVDLGMDRGEVEQLSAYLRAVRALPGSQPSALLVISAHWEEARPTVMSAAQPPMLYDYYNFPQEAYRITWPAPGEPALAARVRALLGAAGFESASDAQRGYDHGTFVPLKLTYPEAHLPVVQLSLKAGLDPAEHLAIGRALMPLREQGVFIIGSGMSFHNMRAFRSAQAGSLSAAFDSWLRESVTLPAPERDARLTHWAQAPGARAAHPREEHLLPLMVVAGAAGADRARVGFTGTMMGAHLSAYEFGAG